MDFRDISAFYRTDTDQERIRSGLERAANAVVELGSIGNSLYDDQAGQCSRW